MNFKNMATDGSNGRPSIGNYPLTRQPSVYSLTFDEFQSTLGGLGKDFGSMNMDEFLKNVWTAEETQSLASALATGEGGSSGANLQRQGSLTLPRTLSQKTVDEVWRDTFRESGGKDGNVGNAGLNLPPRQPTLGEITLEEFLVRAGVVREDTQSGVALSNGGFYGELPRPNNNANTPLGLRFLETGRSDGIVANRIAETNNNNNNNNSNSSNQIPNQSPNLAVSVSGVRSSHQMQQQQLFAKQATMAYAPPLQLGSNADTGNAGLRSSILGIGDSTLTNGFAQGGAGTGIIGLGAGGVTAAVESPGQLSSDGLAKSNGEMSSLSPVPYVFNGLRRKRSSGAVEKVVERRQRRMIKNRESAARSRARKQAYTTELEAEATRLKEQNKELQKKQAEILEMQKNQALEMINQQREPKRRCLRRTQTGPW